MGRRDGTPGEGRSGPEQKLPPGSVFGAQCLPLNLEPGPTYKHGSVPSCWGETVATALGALGIFGGDLALWDFLLLFSL